MLGDADLDAFDAHLVLTKRSNDEYQQNALALISKYEDLLENYKRLKSDYEEEKEAREKYKKLSREQVRNPFVLVLIDGDGYLFNDDLIRANGTGGSQAAQLLNDDIRRILPQILPDSGSENCRIMVQIYANLTGLSKAFAKQKLVGYEKRSLAPFAADFTRSQDLFDFIDADEKKEGADYKIREKFKLFVENSQCRHIIFGGCHDGGYVSLLTPYRARADRITLLRGSNSLPDYHQMGFRVVEFPKVFRTSSLPPLAQVINDVGNMVPVAPKVSQEVFSKHPKTGKICPFFAKGLCRYGASCIHQHIVPPGTNGPHPTNTRPTQKFNEAGPNGVSNSTYKSFPDVRVHLPSTGPPGLLPLNKDEERIDVLIRIPTTVEWNAYTTRLETGKFCNNKHMRGQCFTENCILDHSPLSMEVLHVLQWVLKRTPCGQRGRCRSPDCYYGHLCQRENCKGYKCKFGTAGHNVDPKATEWVKPSIVAIQDGRHSNSNDTGSVAEDHISESSHSVHGEEVLSPDGGASLIEFRE